MKQTTNILLILFGMGLSLCAQRGFAQDPNFHIYLCIGQSNMEGPAPNRPFAAATPACRLLIILAAP